MAEIVMIMGESGSGKSASLRSFSRRGLRAERGGQAPSLPQ